MSKKMEKLIKMGIDRSFSTGGNQTNHQNQECCQVAESPPYEFEFQF